MSDRAPYLVLGIGNELFTDEGLGVVAARRIAELALDGVEVVDGSTLGIELTPAIADRTGVVVLDSLPPEYRAAGTVVVLTDEDVRRQRRLVFSVHQLDLIDALTAAELSGVAPARLALVGMVPASLETGYGVTETVASRLGEMVDRALETLAAWRAPVAVDA